MSSHYWKDFQEIKMLGKGGFSTVFEVKCSKSNSSYAIKKIPFEEKDKEKTLREIKVLSQLNWDYVVRYIASWIEPNYYITTPDPKLDVQSLLLKKENSLLLHIQTELCSMSLRDVIKILIDSNKNSMKTKQFSIASSLLVQIFECVDYLHNLETPIIHRDLKPENIMILQGNRSRCIKLLDFGLSTYHEYIDQSHTKYLGTTSYRAIELNSGKYDTKADIYSLGIIMTELFNFDFNEDNNHVDDVIQTKFEKSKDVCLSCLSAIPKRRPNCTKVLKDKNLWSNFIPNNDLYESIITLGNIKNQTLYDNNFHENKYSCEYLEANSNYKPIVISTGTFSAIIKVKRNSDCSWVAVKKISLKDFSRNDFSQQKEYVQSILDKVSVWSKLDSDFLVKYNCYWFELVDRYDQDKIEKIPTLHIEMELHGLSLCSAIKIINKELDQRPDGILTPVGIFISMHIIIVIIRGVEFLHSQKPLLVHGNLKSTNILIANSCNSCIKICDMDFQIQDTKTKVIEDDINSLCKMFKDLLCLTSDRDEKHNVVIKIEKNFPNINLIHYKLNNGIDFMREVERNLKISTNVSQILDKLHNFFIPLDLIENSLNVKQVLHVACTSLSQKLFKKISLYETSSDLNLKKVDEKLMFFSNKWPLLKTIDKNILNNCKTILSFEEIEKKALIVTKTHEILSQSLSENDDICFKTPQIICELSGKVIKKIVSGKFNVVILMKNHQVFSFGDNEFGQLGLNSFTSSNMPKIIKHLINKNIIDVACGDHHCLALSKNGQIYSWGAGNYGQLGSTFHRSSIPIQVITPSIHKISCGSQHSLVLTVDQEVYGWGCNIYGQLGLSNNSNQFTPQHIKIEDNVKIKDISCGRFHTLLLSINEEIYSFGFNNFCQLGLRHNIDRYRPQKIINYHLKFKAIYTRFDEDFSIALASNKKYYYWGKNKNEIIKSPKESKEKSQYEVFSKIAEQEKLFETVSRNNFKRDSQFLSFISDLNIFNSTNTSLVFNSNIISLSIATIKETKAIMITKDDQVYRIRLNPSIGLSSVAPISLPELSTKKIKKLVFCNKLLMFLTEDNKVFSLLRKQPEVSSTSNKNNQTSCVINEFLTDEICMDIFSMENKFIVLCESGNIYKIIDFSCEPFIKRHPIEFKIRAISCGSNHLIAINEKDVLLSCGSNQFGQLGISNNNDQELPTVLDFESFIIKKVCCGRNHSLLLSLSGEIYSFGQNNFGQLGIGNLVNQNKPKLIRTTTRFIDIYATHCDDISSALSENGIYYIWGDCDNIIKTPIQCDLMSFDEIFASYSKCRVSANQINFEK